MARAVKTAQMIHSRMKAARQLESWTAMPHKIVPKAKPSGFPDEKAEKATFLRREGDAYAAPRMPMAGGTTMAENRPSTPHTLRSQKGFCAKASSSENALNRPSPATNMGLRPSRSASWPRGSWNAPATRLFIRSELGIYNKGMYRKAYLEVSGEDREGRGKGGRGGTPTK